MSLWVVFLIRVCESIVFSKSRLYRQLLLNLKRQLRRIKMAQVLKSMKGFELFG